MCIAVVGPAFRDQRLLPSACFGLSRDTLVFHLPSSSWRFHDRSSYQKRRQLAWDDCEIPICYWLDVFLLYANGRCAKGTFLIGINKRDKFQLYSAVQLLKSNQQNMIQCEITPTLLQTFTHWYEHTSAKSEATEQLARSRINRQTAFQKSSCSTASPQKY